jgi:hypothetical protein
MNRTEGTAKKLWRAGWGVLFIVMMTVLSECSASSPSAAASGAVPSLFSAKTAASAPAPAPPQPEHRHFYR